MCALSFWYFSFFHNIVIFEIVIKNAFLYLPFFFFFWKSAIELRQTSFLIVWNLKDQKNSKSQRHLLIWDFIFSFASANFWGYRNPIITHYKKKDTIVNRNLTQFVNKSFESDQLQKATVVHGRTEQVLNFRIWSIEISIDIILNIIGII